MIDVSRLKDMSRPVLVASTDGVGTKSALAVQLGRERGLGLDLVHHCVNDVAVQGAKPLFFLDYFASGRLEPAQVAAFVDGCAAACRAHDCALLGGETAEMPGIYQDRAIDVVGTIVGAVEFDRILGPERVRPGDALIGLASSGLHTNGFSLARAIVGDRDLLAPQASLGAPLADALLEPHRSYLGALDALTVRDLARSAAHITGGGLPENLPRALPPGLRTELRRGSWPVPPIFGWLQQTGGVSDDEMLRVFNLGLGLVVVVPEAAVDAAIDAAASVGIAAWHVGAVADDAGPPVSLR